MTSIITRMLSINRTLLIMAVAATIGVAGLGGSLVYANIVGGTPSPLVALQQINFTDLELSDDPDEKVWIELLSVSQAIHQPGGGATGQTRRRGDVTLGDIVVVKQIDKASPKIAEAVCNGTVFPKVEIEVASVSPDGIPVEYYKYELEKVLISSYSFSGSTGDVPTEELSLSYEEIKWTYIPQDGTPPTSWLGVNDAFTPNNGKSSCPG